MVATQGAGDTDDDPHEDRRAEDAARQPMLAQPATNTTAATEPAERVPARISPAPARRAAAPSEHILHMHHELVVVRELTLASLIERYALKLAAIRGVCLWQGLTTQLNCRLREHHPRRP